MHPLFAPRFAGMIVTSTVRMFFLMYQLVYELYYELYYELFSVNRPIASLAMGCVMAVVMLGFMWSMYRGTGTKVGVVAVAALLALGPLWGNRTQALVATSRS